MSTVNVDLQEILFSLVPDLQLPLEGEHMIRFDAASGSSYKQLAATVGKHFPLHDENGEEARWIDFRLNGNRISLRIAFPSEYVRDVDRVIQLHEFDVE